MGNLVYSMLTSLDGYVSDTSGGFDWSMPDEELHSYINDVSRAAGTYLLGRRMYQTMVFWETVDDLPGMDATMLEYGRIWREADKIVYSTTLTEVASERTRIERDFDPEAVRLLKESSTYDVEVNGPALAAHALRAGLVDELTVYVCPVIVGGGNAFYPSDVRFDLELLEERRFGNGTVMLNYAVSS